MTRPEFCWFVGPEKTGTTWIQEYLKGRRDVALPVGTKETFFFDRFHWWGTRWYVRHWDPGEFATRLPVEVAPSYFFCERAAGRMRRFAGPATVVCTLREPAARVVSLYYHRRRAGVVRAPLLQAIRQDRVLRRSLHYGPALRRWAEVFGKDRVKVFFFEELRDRPAAFVRELEAATGLTPGDAAPLPAGAVNEGSLARNYYGAKVLRAASYALRSIGAYGLIEAGRKLGLKERVAGSAPLPSERLAEDDAAQLRALLRAEAAEVEAFAGRVPASWKPDA